MTIATSAVMRELKKQRVRTEPIDLTEIVEETVDPAPKKPALRAVTPDRGDDWLDRLDL